MAIIRIKILLLLFSWAMGCASCGQNKQEEEVDPVAVQEASLSDIRPTLEAEKDSLHAYPQLRALYGYSDYTPIWGSFTDRPQRVKELLLLLKESEADGLEPSDYHLRKIQKLARQGNFRQQDSLRMDLLLSDAFLTLAYHYHAGRVQEKGMNPRWDCYNHYVDIPLLVYAAIENNKLRKMLDYLKPSHPAYLRLKDEFARYQKLVEQFPDRAVLKQQLDEIRINLERWRWLPREKDSVFIIVNIPAFQLGVYEEDSLAMQMKVIAGKQKFETPVFNCHLEYLVVRPRWNIPTSIMQDELLPAIIRNPSYLRWNHYYIARTWSDLDTHYIHPDSIRWDTITRTNFPYRLVQAPGPWNPLGAVKFMFPNQFNVYLHDTPAKYLFGASSRAFSHGCIRLEKADELAAYLTANDSLSNSNLYPGYFEENQRIYLKRPIPLSIAYFTAWAGEKGVEFYPDIYRKNKKLLEAMQRRPYVIDAAVAEGLPPVSAKPPFL